MLRLAASARPTSYATFLSPNHPYAGTKSRNVATRCRSARDFDPSITVRRFLRIRGRGCVYAETCVYARGCVNAPPVYTHPPLAYTHRPAYTHPGAYMHPLRIRTHRSRKRTHPRIRTRVRIRARCVYAPPAPRSRKRTHYSYTLLRGYPYGRFQHSDVTCVEQTFALAVTSPVEVAPGVTRPRPGVEVRRETRHGHESRECLLLPPPPQTAH